MAAAVKVMIITAERVAISHREMTSYFSHSSFVMRGITRKAISHILKFISLSFQLLRK